MLLQHWERIAISRSHSVISLEAGRQVPQAPPLRAESMGTILKQIPSREAAPIRAGSFTLMTHEEVTPLAPFLVAS